MTIVFDEEAEAKSEGIYTLLKVFDNQQYAEQFADGSLYSNTLTFLADRKHAGKQWHDPDDGIVGVWQPDKVTVRFGREGHDFFTAGPGDLAAPLKVARTNLHVFCMYALHPGVWTQSFTEQEILDFVRYMRMKSRMNGFGGYVAIVTNVTEFIHRVKTACDLRGIGGSGGLVKYFDLAKRNGLFPEEMHGRIKGLRFRDEREYRFIFRGRGLPVDQPFTFPVGSLRDIVTVRPFEKFRRAMRLRMPGDGREFCIIEPTRLPRRDKRRLKRPRRSPARQLLQKKQLTLQRASAGPRSFGARRRRLRLAAKRGSPEQVTSRPPPAAPRPN